MHPQISKIYLGEPVTISSKNSRKLRLENWSRQQWQSLSLGKRISFIVPKTSRVKIRDRSRADDWRHCLSSCNSKPAPG
ncbi:D-lysergyl-peptide-synthetase subunit 1 [Dissostichus eleginoides]|uniref:D-lysergyl-peptide-synthetase subunit 1 n=1 Tax=Dissostichus eleginoides TaxID=100907 RepID=A0AAD9CFR4_DISEL|nr:D-lysergyl-peptide-synthetase subunit 1 [Dissostichus eleginoides]